VLAKESPCSQWLTLSMRTFFKCELTKCIYTNEIF
jgi:hypothetical protein